MLALSKLKVAMGVIDHDADIAKLKELELHIFAVSGATLEPEETLILIKQLLEVHRRLPMDKNRLLEVEDLEALIKLGNLDESLCDNDENFDWYHELLADSRATEKPYINLVSFVKYYANLSNTQVCGYDTDEEFQSDDDNFDMENDDD